jgi:hypothetical protein
MEPTNVVLLIVLCNNQNPLDLIKFGSLGSAILTEVFGGFSSASPTFRILTYSPFSHLLISFNSV